MGTAGEKKKFYESLPSDLKLPLWKNQTQAEEALRAYEELHSETNEPIPSDTNAFGVEGPLPRLRKHIDFVYIPAVKDASDEATEAHNTAFSRLIDRAVRAKLNVDERIAAIRANAKKDIDELSASHGEVLENLSNLIGIEYKKFNSAESTVHLEWGQFDDKNLQINLPPVRLEISDDLIKNPVAKFGHGTQRNYIMALLLVSATYDFTKLQKLILACEEPELYQHPPQAKLLANSLQSLTSNRTQVIISTHSPYFITAKLFENIRVIRRTLGERSKSYRWSIDENCSLIAKAKEEDPISTKASRAALNQFLQPQMNEMFFAAAIIFVEGDEDKALLGRYFQATGRHHELLNRGIEIVPTSGKGNLINAISIARGFEIPFYVVFDGDMNCNANELEKNVTLNKTLLSLIGESPADGNIQASVARKNFCVWKNSIQEEFEDLAAWQTARNEVAESFGWKVERLKKNAMFLEASLEHYLKKSKAPHLEEIAQTITSYFDTKSQSKVGIDQKTGDAQQARN
ncbi:putative ATPase [Afipia felis]|uniref:ATPase n=1 Tax=Afipia felis TaxID=1035 RepID=A0A090MMN9_AFIFE|nr:AAA family ATPase [Afipia felis]CEG06919.1 putative ATPase [Afipia felis]